MIDQLTEIERENRLLYEKMSMIMTANIDEGVVVMKPLRNVTLNDSGYSTAVLNSKRSLNRNVR